MKLIPTNGERPEELNDEDFVWVQFEDGSMDCRRAISCFWGEHYTHHGWRIPLSNPLVAYCKAEVPEPYAPEPDYSKWIGCLCWMWNGEGGIKKERILKSYAPKNPRWARFFTVDDLTYEHCRPLTPDEIREYLKKAEEACKGG